MVKVRGDNIVVDLKVMRHHANKHRLPIRRINMDGPAVNASHRGHGWDFIRPIIEVIQPLRRCQGQGVIAVAQGHLFMAEALVLEHAATSETDFLIYTGNFCGYCRALKNLLNRKDLSYTEYNFDEHDGMRMAVVQATGHRTVPVVFDLRGEQPMFIGGFDETNRYLKKTS